MELKNEQYSVRITIDETYYLRPSEARVYDLTYETCDDKSEEFCKILAVSVESVDRKYSIALIGNYYASDDRCAVLEGAILTVLQGWNVLRLDLDNGKMIQNEEFDSIGTFFHLYKVAGGYIIHGEGDIIMLDQRLREKWSFGGPEIFVSITGKNEFEIKEDRICLYDFDDNYFEIDMNGQQLVFRAGDPKCAPARD